MKIICRMGHEKVLDKTTVLRAPEGHKSYTFEDNGLIMYLRYKGGSLKYPRPSNLVTAGKESYEPGDTVCSAYETTSPIYKLNALVSLMIAKGSPGKRYFEKESIIQSDCYCYEDGKIMYKEVDGEIEVWIGKVRYNYNPSCIYLYPEGTEIKKFQRFCSGIINMNHVVNHFETDINSVYLIFRKQFGELWYKNDGYPEKSLGSTTVPEEIIEMLFISLVHSDVNQKTLKLDNLEFLGAQRGIMDSKSFYTLLSYGFSSRIISNAIKGDVRLKDDVMTETVLGLLLNNKLDETRENNKLQKK